jgi:hypothetical protein
MSGISDTPKQSDVFEKRYQFSTGVKVSRFEDSFLQERAMLNPIRQALHKRLDLKKSFGTAKEFYDHTVLQRKLHSIGNNTTGGLEIKKDHIGFSLAPVQDYEATIPTEEEEGFTIENRYFRNSPFNGAKFTDEDGQAVCIKNANSSPWDRTEFDLQSERLTQKKDGTSIFYAGRPDTLERAKLLGIDMFLNELATKKRKGVVDKGDTIEFHYIVDSLTNPTAGLSKWRQLPLAPQALDERASLKWEQEALNKLYASNEPLEVDFEGKKYQVLLRPMHVHNTVSCLGTYQFFNDKGRELENSINEASYHKLINYYKELKNLPPRLKNFGDEIVQILESAKKSTDIEVHRRVAMIDMLAKICNLPIAHHCKSVVDRTSGAASVSIVNQLVYDEKFLSSIPSFDQILKDNEYKEYYLKAMQTQLSVSGDLRTAVDPSGRLNCKRLLPAFMWRSSPDTQAHGFLPLLPDRALKEFTVAQRIINFAKQIFLFLISPLTCLVGLPVIKPTWIKHNKAFDLESDALSEKGTRPLLEGPHNKRLKDSLTSSTIFGKKRRTLNDFNIDVVRKKAWPLFNLLSLKEQKELYPANLKNEGRFSLDLEEFYTASDSHKLDTDIRRSNYTFDGSPVTFRNSQEKERVHDPEVYNRLKSKIDELGQNSSQQKKYLEEILTQRFLALLATHLRKEHFVDLRPTELSYNFSSSEKCVTVSIQAGVRDLFSSSEDEQKKLEDYDFTIRFPFDHKEKATVKYKKNSS